MEITKHKYFQILFRFKMEADQKFQSWISGKLTKYFQKLSAGKIPLKRSTMLALKYYFRSPRKTLKII